MKNRNNADNSFDNTTEKTMYGITFIKEDFEYFLGWGNMEGDLFSCNLFSVQYVGFTVLPKELLSRSVSYDKRNSIMFGIGSASKIDYNFAAYKVYQFDIYNSKEEIFAHIYNDLYYKPPFRDNIQCLSAIPPKSKKLIRRYYDELILKEKEEMMVY